MKISLTLTFLILALGGLLCSREIDRLTRVRETNRQIAASVRARVFSPDNIGPAGKSALGTRRNRQSNQDKIAQAKALANEGIAWKKAQKTNSIDESRALWEALSDKLAALDPSQVQTLLEEIRISEDLDEIERTHLVQLSLLILGQNHPEAALTLLAQSLETRKMDFFDRHVASIALTDLAEANPIGALEWFRSNGLKSPGLLTDQTKSALLYGIAKVDPGQALGLIDELKFESRESVLSYVTLGANTEKGRTDLLAALRNYGGKGDELPRDSLKAMGMRLAEGDYEKSQAWVSSAKLSDQEMQNLLKGITFYGTKDQTGKWISWMADQLSPNMVSPQIEALVSGWTHEDYEAAATWIGTCPEGLAKQVSVKAYALTLAPFDPASSAQWALTLPLGKERDDLFRKIHAEWTKKDPAAAANFEQEHGLGK